VRWLRSLRASHLLLTSMLHLHIKQPANINGNENMHLPIHHTIITTSSITSPTITPPSPTTSD